MSSFKKDIAKITSQNLSSKLKEVIQEVEDADNLFEIRKMEKLTKKKEYYRIRTGYYRIGIKYEKDQVIFIRFLHR